MTETCKHELPVGSCATCSGPPRDRLAELIDSKTTTCSATRCGAEIVWAKTDAGRNMPVDAETDPDGAIELFVEDGELRARVLKRRERSQATLGTLVELRTSHFATCTEAGSFRR